MTTATPPDMNAVLGNEDACIERLAPLWRAADTFPHYRCTTSDVVELLRVGGGFDVSPELLEGWIRSGMVPEVRLRSSQFAWSATNIVVAMIQADTWRRWIALDPRHIHKLTAVEIEEARAAAAGTTTFTDLATFDCCAFIEILSRCNNHDMRATFAVALKTKLRQLGVLDK